MKNDRGSRVGGVQDAYFGHEHLTVIEPARGWRALNLGELWAYRELIYVLFKRDVKVRYKQTVLGAMWAILQPLLTMAIFVLIFGHLAKMPSDGYPYPIFFYSAMLPWTFFANAVSSSANSLVNQSNLISKVYFPRLAIPLASIGSGLVDFFIAGSILLLLMLHYGLGWGLHLLVAPFLLLAVVFTALGVGTLLSALTVAYRDFRYVVPFLLQLWMFATPVVYPSSLVPERWHWLLFLNPMSGIIDAFRSVFLGRSFDLGSIAISFAVALLLFVCGIAYFEKVERRFADII